MQCQCECAIEECIVDVLKKSGLLIFRLVYISLVISQKVWHLFCGIIAWYYLLTSITYFLVENITNGVCCILSFFCMMDSAVCLVDLQEQKPQFD